MISNMNVYLFSGLAGTFLSLPWVLRYQVKDRGEVKALFPEEIGAIVLRKLRDYAEELACGKVQVSIMFHTTHHAVLCIDLACGKVQVRHQILPIPVLLYLLF